MDTPNTITNKLNTIALQYMLIMSTLLLIILTYFKIISVLFSLVLIFAHIEAYYLLNKQSYYFSGRWSNDDILPPTFTEIGDKHLSDLLLLKFKLLVFGIAYSRIYYGKFYFLKKISIKKFFIFIFLYYFQISRFFIILALVLINYAKSKNIDSFLYDIFVHPYDHRRLVKINNVWHANGPNDFLKSLLNLAKTKTNSKITFDEDDIKKFDEIIGKLKTFNKNTKYYYATFLDINKKPHKIFLDSTDDNKTVGMQTDKTSSVRNNNYGKDPLIFTYKDKKLSTLLLERLDNLEQITQEKEVSNYFQIKGASEYGYNKYLLSTDYKKSIDSYTEIYNNVDYLINSKDWDITHHTLMSSLEDVSFSGSLNSVKDL